MLSNKISSIQGRFTAMLAVFVLLIGGTFAASYFVLQQQADDGLTINLAGRQRMLTQRMTKESLLLGNAALLEDTANVGSYRDALSQSARVFDMTLQALTDGGPAPTNLEMTRMRETPAAPTPEIRAQLLTIGELWKDFKANVDSLVKHEGRDRTAISAISNTNLRLLNEMNTAVVMLQKQSETKVNGLYTIQIAALLVGLALVGLGYWFAGSGISAPILDLAEAAHRMSTGDLNVEFRKRGTREVQALADSFDRMRASMLATIDSGTVAATGTDDF